MVLCRLAAEARGIPNLPLRAAPQGQTPRSTTVGTRGPSVGESRHPVQEARPDPSPHATPAALLWTLAFVAVLAHLPALAGYFAQDDWEHLARGAGVLPFPDIPARPISSLLYWRALWPLFGLAAAPYHATALVLWCACVLLTARVGARLGLGVVGSGVAGMIAAATPVAIVPIFWASATAELLAACFALAALDRWLAGGVRNSLLAVALAALGALSKECGLALPALLALAWLWRLGEARRDRPRRTLIIAVAASAVVSVAAGWMVLVVMPHGHMAPYALGGPRSMLRNLGVLGGWLLSPWRFAPASTAALPWVGALLWAGWAAAALAAWRRGARVVAFALALALGVVGPALPLYTHLNPYYLLLAVPALGWSIGWLVRQPAERMLNALSTPTAPHSGASAALLVAGAAAALLGWSATRASLWARDGAGLLTDPLASRSSISARVERQVRALPLTSHSTVVVLQATRLPIPDTIQPPPGGVVIAVTPVHAALAGRVGLSLLVPKGATVRWTTHLDDVPADAFVLMDSGDPVLRIWGSVTSARMYSALVAVTAQQFWRARHDLWSVIELQPSEVAFVYQPQSLPFPPEQLDDSGPAFAQMLRDEGSPSSYRVLSLFAKMYQAVRNRPLPDAAPGSPPAPAAGGSG